ncbi:uncharacterized protein LOC135474810 [Liolophura sinensis]|uniref:uncharacterized protein LOC135474810 n=1 Tax=Liolophura sinensis TaxID=3198878 RepID=UPI003158946B
MGICSPDAICQNSPGSYSCACEIGFVGDGIECIRSCELNHHCAGENNFCNTSLSVCQCREGFEGDAFFGCTDIDECDLGLAQCGNLMYCENLNGTYDCPCVDGFFKVGDECIGKPRNCNDIKIRNSRSRDGTYEVDPDGPGGVPAFDVYCDFQPTFGITVLFAENTNGESVRNYLKNKEIKYEATQEQIQALMDSSPYCYQDMRFRCGSATDFLKGQTYWQDGNGVRHYSWGGATESGKCVCGQLGTCATPEDNCYCNGEDSGKEDRGRIIDKSQLPIVKVYFGDIKSGQRANLKITNLKCGPHTFDLAESCHEYKFSGRYWIRKDTPMYIDVDGPQGNCDPMLVHCNMEKYKNVGITVFHHHDRDPAVVQNSGRLDFDYQIPSQCLRKAVDNSAYCSQSAYYQCKNSRLYNNGDVKGYLGGLDGQPIPFFAGGMGIENMCGCGVSGSCEDPSYNCNCDIADGKERIDQGVMHEKDYLPISFVSFSEIGGNATGTYSVGPLQCAEKQFGIPPSCLAVRADGNTLNHNYLIDPDQGSDIQKYNNVEPFNVYCEFSDVGISATTIVYHENWNVTMLTASDYIINYKYYLLVKKQIEALKRTSAYCFQDVTLACKKAHLHVNGVANFDWKDLDFAVHNYFHGNGAGQGCACHDTNNCTGGGLCNCDAQDELKRFDYGVLTNMNEMPVIQAVLRGLTGLSEADLTVGPLICTENFPTCHQINDKFVPAKNAFGLLEDGEFYVDPDGIDPLEPFLVQCAFPVRTILPTTDGTDNGPPFPFGFPQCFDIEYAGNPSPEQIQALVNSSAFCEQKVAYYCRNSPFTNKVTYKTCDGREQRGWGGSQGQPGCGCGVTGTCDKCLCDTGSSQTQKDEGFIRAKWALPVCSVCFDLDPVDFGDPSRYSKTVVESLVCYPHTGHVPGTCQDIRNSDIYHSGEQELTTEIDPDGPFGNPPLPVTCLLTGPLGVVVIEPMNPVIEVPLEGIEIEILYFFLNFTFIRDVIEESVYCEQSLHIECFDDATFAVNANSAWQSADGTYQEYWAGNTGGIGCEGGECNCGFQDGRERIDGGLLTDQDALPATGLKLPASTGARRVTISALKCYVVYKDCNEILQKTGGKNSPSGDKTWPVDPDAEGGVEPFTVKCDFYSHKHMGITVIKTDTAPVDVVNAIEPGSFQIPVSYLPSPAQINALTIQSEYCYQNVEFQCTLTPLINDFNPAYGFLTGVSNVSSNFAAGDSTVVGCACELSGTCPANHSCRCDVKSSEPVLERGVLLNESIMPITLASFGGQTSEGASGVFKVGDVLCAPEVFDVPVDCEEARQLGMTTGDTLIRPHAHLDPIMVFCEMREDFGITIVGTSVTNTPGNVTYPGKVDVTYFDVPDVQLRQLVKMSVCYQPVKFDCKNTEFLKGDKAFWLTMGSEEKRRYFGHANPWENKCSCGHDRLCGGTPDEGKFVQRARKCNCDAGDDVWRRDAGIISDHLPIDGVQFNAQSHENAEGLVTVGYLYCAPQEFDLDECALDFHDCDANADCINLPGAFECRCREGYRGWGLDRSKYFATGRVCYDDDECALNRCGWSAVCENLEGSYRCHCKNGFTQVDDQTCKDIDECKTGDNNCDENAYCINTPGSYQCRCNRGYRGNGIVCEEIGICTCFGDPHCRSFDDRWLHFQGACQYTMVRDNCEGDQLPTFQVLQKNWRRGDRVAIDTEVSWVKEITIIIDDLTITLKQGLVLHVNGIARNLPFSPRAGIAIYYTLHNIEVRTSFGLHVRWNGYTSVDVILPTDFKEKTCGLCGNYNEDPTDDWITGPRCPPGGEITDNNNEFGQSWAVDYPGQAEDTECSIDCDSPPDGDRCTEQQKRYAEEYCLIIFSKTSVFKDCIALLGDEVYAQYKESCIYDLCDGNVAAELCATAKDFVNECQTTYNVQITGWRSPAFCDPKCKENQVYTTCGKPSEQQYCVGNDTQAVPQNSGFECEEGCLCPNGFMISGTNCVRPDECGCYVDGTYYAVNEVVFSGNCSTITTCGDDRQLKTTPAPACGQDEICTVKDGIEGCHCKEGFMRTDEGTCTDDHCYKHNCTKNSECVSTEDSYECVCVMGFTGFCNNCDDVDECATNTHECDGRAQCQNTIGSYRCFCEPGLIALDGRVCVDKDECSLGIHDCDENAQCVNTYKGYECVCCLGYTDGPNGTCVEEPGDKTGGECCACVGDGCHRPGPVCGSDFNTYASERDLVVSACLRENSVTLAYRGECQGTCANVVCEGWEVCRPDPGTGLPICTCESCSQQQLEIVEELCDSSGNIFMSMCEFRAAMCLTGSDSEPTPIDGCSGLGSGVSLTPWTEWSPCSVTCGKGEKTRTRSWKTGNPSPGVEARVAMRATTECYEPACVTGPCVVDVCTGPGEECVEYDGVAQCECPECTNGGVDPVCALVGTSVGTYLSACKAQRAACVLNLPYEILHEGNCGVRPVKCQRMPLIVPFAMENGCYAENTVNLWTCDGGCGPMSNLCCDSVEDEETLTIDLTCPDGSARNTTVPIVSRCFCREENDVSVP